MKSVGQNRYVRCTSWLIALSFIAVAIVGCSDDKTPPTNVVVPDAELDSDTSPNDVDDSNADPAETDAEGSDTDVPPGACDGVVCLPGEACVGGVCEAVGDVGFSCEKPRDLGVLAAGTPLKVAGNSDGQPVLLETGCASEHNSSQSVYKFRVSQNAQVSAKILTSTQPVVMELREDGCVDGSDVLFCDMQPRTFEAKAGKDYYLVVEARHDYSTGDFEVELTTGEAQVCSPAGSWTCDGTARVQCFAGKEERPFECGSSCSEGVCGGDTCENAIVVDGSVSLQGTTRAFENKFDFKDSPSCSTDKLTGPMTNGQDIVFSLPGLTAGQQVKIDTNSASGRGVIGITKSCGLSAGCIAADDQTGKLNWTVDVAGDYFVIVDRGSTVDVPFDYRIEVLD